MLTWSAGGVKTTGDVTQEPQAADSSILQHHKQIVSHPEQSVIEVRFSKRHKLNWFRSSNLNNLSGWQTGGVLTRRDQEDDSEVQCEESEVQSDEEKEFISRSTQHPEDCSCSPVLSAELFYTKH